MEHKNIKKRVLNDKKTLKNDYKGVEKMKNCENCKFSRLNKPYTRGGRYGGQTILLISCTYEHRYITRKYNAIRPLKCGHYEDKET